MEADLLGHRREAEARAGVIFANRGLDTSTGGDGDERLRTRDGEVDRITCGPGRDRTFSISST